MRQDRARVAAISVVPLPPLTAQQTVTDTETSRVRPVAGPSGTQGDVGDDDRSEGVRDCQPQSGTGSG